MIRSESKPIEFYYKSYDGETIYAQHRPAAAIAKGVIQIAHGLGETADYYKEFADHANQAGFVVYINDVRGHGRTAGDISTPQYRDKAGDIGNDGFIGMRDDLAFLTRIIRKDYPGIPVFLLGHSMGSIAARLYAAAYGKEIHGLILTGALSEPENSEGLLNLVEEEIVKNGLKAPSIDTFYEFFKEVNKQFEPVETELDWITSDKAMIRDSLESPYTYISFNNQFFRNLLHSLKALNSEEYYSEIPDKLPVFLLSGGKDSVTDNGRTVTALSERFKQSGTTDTSYKIYDNHRHSLLRETNRTEVARDILDWCLAHL